MSGISAQDRLQEASRWFAVRRRGVMTVEERALYENWASDSDNLSAMARLEQTWTMLGVAKQAGQVPSLPPRSRLARPALLAAMCVVSLGIGVLSYADDTGFWTTLNWTDR
jgi:ferric-dicitrate binding protein FerR (iron transport regulator)